MKTTCSCAKAKTQAGNTPEVILLPALEKRAETLSTVEQRSFVPATDFVPVPIIAQLPAAEGVSDGAAHHAGRAVLHARGISLPGVERMNVSHKRRCRCTGFTAGGN